MSGGDSGLTRYEAIMQAAPDWPADLGARLAAASRAARAAVTAAPGHQTAIRDVAAGVAGPALTMFASWLLDESRRRGLEWLRFLSRDGQVLYELVRRLTGVSGGGPDLDYVYSSRITWSLAATDPSKLADTPWLLNSFIKSNAADVCARLGLPAAEFRQAMLDCGVSLDPDVRADQPSQAYALRRFAATPEAVQAVGARISVMRRLVLDYAAQHQLADSATGLVDIGWTGRMVGSFIELCEAAGMDRPAVLFWGHERRATGWTDPDRVAAWMYNTATGQGLQWRVPNAPFIMETFCMGDHGIVSGYRKDASGTISPGSSRLVMTLRTHGDFGCTGRCCTPSLKHWLPTAACPRAMRARSSTRSSRLSGVVPPRLRRLRGAAIPMTATRQEPLCGPSPGRSLTSTWRVEIEHGSPGLCL